MFIVQFILKKKQYTWFLDDGYAVLAGFFITSLILVIIVPLIKKILSLNSKKKKIINPSGGDYIDICVDPDSIYEIIDSSLEIVVKRMLNLPISGGPVIISVNVLIIAYVVLNKPLSQLSILGTKIIAENISKFMVSFMMGVGISISAMCLMCVANVGILPNLIITILSLIVSINLSHGRINCDNLLLELPLEIISPKKTIAYLDTPLAQNFKVIVKANEKVELFAKNSLNGQSCESKFLAIKGVKKHQFGPIESKVPQIERSCRGDFVPLNERTKTLSDLLIDDSSMNRNEAAPYIKRYEKKRLRINRDRQTYYNVQSENIPKNALQKNKDNFYSSEYLEE
jgi:hypothetical protein